MKKSFTCAPAAIRADWEIGDKNLAKPLIESPVRGDIYVAPAFKPGLKSLKNSAANPEAARQRESGLRPFPSVYGDGIPKLTSIFVSLHQAMSGYISLSQPILPPLFFSVKIGKTYSTRIFISKPFKEIQRRSKGFKGLSEQYFFLRWKTQPQATVPSYICPIGLSVSFPFPPQLFTPIHDYSRPFTPFHA